jgi:ABC-2 type transport system permease protein
MNARRFALLSAFACLIIFVAGNVIANSWFRSWRIDLTESQLYSLSPGTQRILDTLAEPVEMRLYYSRDAAAAFPQVQSYAGRVREMLQTLTARSSGRMRFVEVNVEAFTEEEDEAVENGIEALRPYQGADPIYFGLAGANAVDERRVIPSFDPQREPFLEYELIRLVYELQQPERTRVALITALPLDPAAAADPTFPSGQTVFAAEFGRLMDVVKLAPNFTEIPDVDVLAIIHPWPLSPAQAYAVDQFVMRRGRAFIAIDPASLTAQQAGGGFNPMAPMSAPTASSLEPMLSRWGITMAPTVVLDGEGALPVQVTDENGQTGEAPQPLFVRIAPEAMDSNDLMTAQLQRGINLGLTGGLGWSEREGVTVTALARTSGQTMRLPAERALMRPSPSEIMSMWLPSGGRRETVALRLSGNLETAFPNGAPAGEPQIEGAPPAAPAQTAAPLTKSEIPAEIVVVADVDFLADEFYVDRSGAPAADNAALALNAIDVLGGSSDLVSLRSRAPSIRPMKRLEDMERDAQRRIETEQDRLRQDLAEAEARLTQLQQRGRGSGYFTGNFGAELTPEENAEMERFRARVLDARTALRGVERNLRADIERLKAAIMFVNVWLAPLLVAGVGFFLFWRRQRRVGARP